MVSEKYREKVLNLAYMNPSLIIVITQIPRTYHHSPHCWTLGELIMFPLACMGAHAAILDILAFKRERKSKKTNFEQHKAKVIDEIMEIENDFDKKADMSGEKGSENNA